MSVIKITAREVGNRQVRELQLAPMGTAADLLKELGHNQEVVVVRRNGRIVPEGEQLADGDEIEIIPVVSGG